MAGLVGGGWVPVAPLVGVPLAPPVGVPVPPPVGVPVDDGVVVDDGLVPVGVGVMLGECLGTVAGGLWLLLLFVSVGWFGFRLVWLGATVVGEIPPPV
ncbi:hypothetical protein ACFVXQ_13275, partial [Kitasatospora sp. NPDC058263]